jgi:4-hydroxybenzoate polyprenyltransferase
MLMRHRSRGARQLSLALSFGAAFLVWNVVFDAEIDRGVKYYLYNQALSEQGRGPEISLAEVMLSARRKAVGKASALGALLAAAGLVSASLIPAQEP